MILHHPNAEKTAKNYIGTDEPLVVLGWGVDGVVYTHPSVPNAVKIHTYPEKFERELRAYQRLRRKRVEKFMGFSVPVLMTSSEENLVIELSIVKPPFLLDFAAATLDRPNDFTPDASMDFWTRVEEDFGDDFDRARDVFWGLKREHGIYYWDIRPRNLCFR